MADPMLNRRHSSEDGKPELSSPENLITQNIDIWTTAIERKSSAGRGTSNKFSLYGIKKLRELILELAVRGKLVPQDVNDEPASVILERIAAEKAQLVKESKLKKQKPLPEICDDEKPFEVPNGWVWLRLNEAAEYNGRPNLDPKNITDNTWLLDLEDIEKDSSRLLYKAVYSERESKSNKSTFQKGDVLYGKLRPYLNKVIIADDDGVCTTEIVPIVPNEAVNAEYLKYLLKSPSFLNYVNSLMYGVKMPRLGTDDAIKSIHPIAPLKEQLRIVAKIDELMSLCDALEAQTEASISAHQTLVETLLNALLLPNTTQPADNQSASPEPALNDSFIDSWQRVAEHFDTLFTTAASIDALKQTILQLAVMGKLVEQASCEARNSPNYEPAAKLLDRIAAEKAQLIKDGKIKKQKPLPAITDEEKSFELPNGWVYTRLDELCLSVSSGSTPPKSELSETSGIPFLKVYNIQNQVIDFEERTLFVTESSHLGKLKRSILYPGDVVMNLVGPPLGKIAIIPNTYPEWNCNQNIICFRPLEIRLNLYIYTYLTAQIFLNQIELVGSAGQDFISGTKSRAIVLPFPPLEEQHRIVAKVDELMALCEQLKARLSDSQTTQLHLTDAIVEQAVN
jgi:type I restriction enzyme S subunit